MNNTCCYSNSNVLDIDTTDSRPTSLVTVKECIFSDNILGDTAVIGSTGYQGNSLIIDRSVFKNNLVSDGRRVAIWYSGGILNILNSNFSNNEIANNLNGGAIYVDVTYFNSTILISNCHFNGNVASGFGGAIFASQVLISITNSSSINNKVISSSGFGGAIFASHVNITITNTIFIDNSAGSTSGYGGAVFVHRMEKL